MLTGKQIREARELLGWTRAELARRAFLALSVVEVVEDHGSTFMLLDGQALAIRRVCERAGVEFVSTGGDGGGVRLRDRKDTPSSLTEPHE